MTKSRTLFEKIFDTIIMHNTKHKSSEYKTRKQLLNSNSYLAGESVKSPILVLFSDVKDASNDFITELISLSFCKPRRKR